MTSTNTSLTTASKRTTVIYWLQATIMALLSVIGVTVLYKFHAWWRTDSKDKEWVEVFGRVCKYVAAFARELPMVHACALRTNSLSSIIAHQMGLRLITIIVTLASTVVGKLASGHNFPLMANKML